MAAPRAVWAMEFRGSAPGRPAPHRPPRVSGLRKSVGEKRRGPRSGLPGAPSARVARNWRSGRGLGPAGLAAAEQPRGGCSVRPAKSPRARPSPAPARIGETEAPGRPPAAPRRSARVPPVARRRTLNGRGNRVKRSRLGAPSPGSGSVGLGPDGSWLAAAAAADQVELAGARMAAVTT